MKSAFNRLNENMTICSIMQDGSTRTSHANIRQYYSVKKLGTLMMSSSIMHSYFIEKNILETICTAAILKLLNFKITSTKFFL
jgi:hypothetical protein